MSSKEGLEEAMIDEMKGEIFWAFYRYFERRPFNHLGTSPDMFELRFDGEKNKQIIKFCWKWLEKPLDKGVKTRFEPRLNPRG